MDFIQAYNAYALAQTYLKRGRHTEAVVEYEQSLRRLTRLDDAARSLLREQYGLSQEQIERELSIARALAQERTTTAGDTAELERFRERVWPDFIPMDVAPSHRARSVQAHILRAATGKLRKVCCRQKSWSP